MGRNIIAFNKPHAYYLNKNAIQYFNNSDTAYILMVNRNIILIYSPIFSAGLITLPYGLIIVIVLLEY